MAERLARRASARPAITGAAAQLETVAPYGVKFMSYESQGGLRLHGEAFARVLAQLASAAQRARATLALARHVCIDLALRTSERLAFDISRAAALDRLDAATLAALPGPLKNRVRLRRAGVWAAWAFEHSRSGGPAHGDAQRALDELATVDRNELGDVETMDYDDAALRVGASRSAALGDKANAARLALSTLPGDDPGQTCVTMADPARPQAAPLLRCRTFGTVWPASWRVAPDGSAAVLAVQPLPTWTELWVFRLRREGWRVEVLTPAASAEPRLGYAEFAGFVPGQRKLLLVREARDGRVEGRTQMRFDVLSLDTLVAER